MREKSLRGKRGLFFHETGRESCQMMFLELNFTALLDNRAVIVQS